MINESLICCVTEKYGIGKRTMFSLATRLRSLNIFLHKLAQIAYNPSEHPRSIDAGINSLLVKAFFLIYAYTDR